MEKKVRRMCGNCIHNNESYPFTPPGLIFCNFEGIQEYHDPYDRPCIFFEAWENPLYLEKNETETN